MSQINGRISQIIGPVIDVYFDTKGENPEKVLPKIHEALKVKRPDGRDLVIEVQQHIGEDTVRCVARTIPMACSVDWRLSLRATQLSCQQVSKSRVV